MLFFKKKKYIKSKKELKDLLPTGTIVTLKNDDQKYMIDCYFGNIKYNSKELQKSSLYKVNNEPEYNVFYQMDYSLIPYPLGSSFAIFEPLWVNEEDIDKVIFRGFESDDRSEFMKTVDDIRKEVGD